MALLTEDEKKAVESQRFVVLRSNVGQYQQGEVVSGRQLAAENVQRLLWGKHVREATAFEAGLAKVTLQDDEDQHLSYEYRMSVLEQENRKLRRNEPPPRPAPGTPGAEDRPQQAAGQKTPSPGDARPTPPDRKPR
jgi:hypothetical protein